MFVLMMESGTSSGCLDNPPVSEAHKMLLAMRSIWKMEHVLRFLLSNLCKNWGFILEPHFTICSPNIFFPEGEVECSVVIYILRSTQAFKIILISAQIYIKSTSRTYAQLSSCQTWRQICFVLKHLFWCLWQCKTANVYGLLEHRLDFTEL